MAFEGDRLAMLLGTPGGSGQTITLTQVLTNMVDYKLDLEAAIAQPRWSMDLQGNFALEPEIDGGHGGTARRARRRGAARDRGAALFLRLGGVHLLRSPRTACSPSPISAAKRPPSAG